MKLAFIGNSHIVAVRQAWDEIATARPKLKATYFAASGTRLKNLKARKGALVGRKPGLRKQLALTSDGDRAIRIGDYDAFVLVGLRLGAVDLLRAGAEHRPLSAMGDATIKHLVSEEAFDLSVVRLFEETEFVKIVRLIRSVSSKARIVAAPTPWPNRDITSREARFWVDTAVLGERIEPVYRAALDRFAAHHEVAIVEQRAATIEDRYFTRGEFGEGTVRLDRPDRPGDERDEVDQRHMNAAYGAIVLEDVLARLAAKG